MNPIVLEQLESGNHLYNGGVVQSVNPPETGFGYFVFAHMIPPFKPSSTLLLGYGSGTTAELIRKIWGDVKITGVDLIAFNDRYNEYKMKFMDARDFVDDCVSSIIKKRYDYICIDLWEGNKVPEFIFSVDFSTKIRQMATKLISMNIRDTDLPKTEFYYNAGFRFDRGVQCDANHVMWWSVRE